MKTIKVYGALRKRLGGQKLFKFDVRSPAEGLKALMANFSGLEKWLIDSEKDGIGYVLKVGDRIVDESNLDQLGHPWSEKEAFCIVPVVTGSWRVGRWFRRTFSNPIVRIVTGVVLVAAAVLLAPAGTAFFGGLVTGAGSSVATIGTFGASLMAGVGTLMAVSGVSQAISPQPEFPGMDDGYNPERGEGATRLESFAISGISNTQRQGMACSIAYGRVFTGSAVLSVGFDVDQTH